MSLTLAPVPEQREHVIVVGTSVRKPLPILQAYLQSLAWQELPSGIRLLPVFVPDWPEPNTEAEQALRAWVGEHGGEVLRAGPVATGDFDDAAGLSTHHWTHNAMYRVAASKNRIIKRALELHAEYIWFADSDLIMDRTTLWSMLACDKPITCAVYWTHWERARGEIPASPAGPQVWLRHPYLLDGRGMEAGEFRAKLVNRELVRVYGQGACSLIHSDVVRAGITFEHLPDPALHQGLMAGEDRHFCLRAERAHIEMWADAWPDIFHIYHQPEQVQEIPARLAALGAAHPDHAMVGDLVNLRLIAEEPLPGPSGWFRAPPQFVRGRLGALPLLPELEEAVCNLKRGDTQTVATHFPTHYPNGWLRGKRRLIRVTLVDCKPNSAPPVLAEELHFLPVSGRHLDMTLHTERQQEAIRG